jgi:hypothetical protein
MSNLLKSALPTDPLAAIRRLTESEQELELLRFEMVKRARRDGRSWEEIAVALGISRQSAWQYFSPRILNEADQEENGPRRLSAEEATDIAVSESRAVRRRRRSNPV